jgi:hypothetical protein
MAVAAPREAAELLRWDTPIYAEECLRIVNKAGDVIPLRPKPAQLKFDAVMERQRAEGKPIRILLPKARQWGGSTWTAAKIFQRVTQFPNRRARVMAHKDAAAKNLFGMYETMYSHLPDDEPGLPVKPPLANSRRQAEMWFANPSRLARQRGDLGLNSSILAQTAGDARESDSQRSYTIHFLHGSECAFWVDLKTNLTALLQTVPYEPETIIVLESTANGMNHWQKLCRQAEEGESDFELVFVPWFEEPGYVRRFGSAEERAEFVVGAGTGPGEWYEDEAELVETFGLSLEQLLWRRWAIVNLCQSDLTILHQEYPSTLEESFIATGAHVFQVAFVRRMLDRTEPPKLRGNLVQTGSVMRPVVSGLAEVPTGAQFAKAAAGGWLVWEEPKPKDEEGPPGQYVVTVDPAGETEDEEDTDAYHAIEVGNHRTLRQCAEYRTRGDADLVAKQAYLAALWFGQGGIMPWIAVERTGGYGTSIITILRQRYKYPFVYRERPQDRAHPHEKREYGWLTSPATKPPMIDRLKEGLREDFHGVRSAGLAREFLTYVRNERGKMKPESGEFADRLMAWAIFHMVAQEKPLRDAAAASSEIAQA